MGPEQAVGESKMKISKQRLKEIIREELGSVEEGVFSSRIRNQSAQTNLASAQRAEKLVKQLVDEFNNAGSNEEKKEIQGRIQALVKAVSHIQEGSREDMMMPAISQADFDAAQATDDEKFTGGTPEERLLTLMKARELLAAMSKEELTQLSLSLDGETTRALQHLLANPMYGG
jgi:hypothetical protein